MILYTSISGYINGIAVIIFGLLILLHNPKNKVNRLMALLCLSVAFWAISLAVQASIQEKNVALFWIRMLNFGAIFIPIFFLHWVLALLGISKENKNKIILSLGYLLTLFFTISNFTPYFVEGIKFELYSYFEKPGVLHPFYLIFCYGGFVGYALYNLFKSYKKATDYKKLQIKYVFLGSALGFAGGATNYFLAYNIPIPPLGNPLVAVGFGLFTYAVIRHHLMDIKLLISEVLTFIIWIILFARTILSKTYGEALINIGLFILVVFLGCLLIRSVFKEIKLSKKLLEQNEKLLEKEKCLSRTFGQIAEERARRLENTYMRGTDYDLQILKMQERVKELEEKLKRRVKS